MTPRVSAYLARQQQHDDAITALDHDTVVRLREELDQAWWGLNETEAREVRRHSIAIYRPPVKMPVKTPREARNAPPKTQ